MQTTTTVDGVFVLDLGDGDNRFTDTSVGAINEFLTEVERAEGPKAAVITASGKIWSNGLDLDHLASLGGGAREFISALEETFARLLRLDAPTIAAIPGHVFGAGAMMALALDVRIMRDDRGFFCLPEVDLGMTFSPGLASLVGAKLAQPALHRLAVLGERLPALTAAALGAVDHVAPQGQVLDVALDHARRLAPKAGPTIAALRRNFYRDALDALQQSANPQTHG